MANDVNRRLAENLKSLRKRSNKKQFEMALLFNISQQNYSKLENGKTHFKNDVVSKVCEIFKISPDEFFYGTLNKPANADDAALKKHFEVLWMESELRCIKLEQRIRNYIPFQETSREDSPQVYVII